MMLHLMLQPNSCTFLLLKMLTIYRIGKWKVFTQIQHIDLIEMGF